MKTHLHGFNLRCSDSHLLLLRLLSMKKCIDATNYRRRFQIDYNAKHGKEMKSTQGSSVLTIFELLKDQIEAVTFEDTTSDIATPKALLTTILLYCRHLWGFIAKAASTLLLIMSPVSQECTSGKTQMATYCTSGKLNVYVVV